MFDALDLLAMCHTRYRQSTCGRLQILMEDRSELVLHIFSLNPYLIYHSTNYQSLPYSPLQMCEVCGVHECACVDPCRAQVSPCEADVICHLLISYTVEDYTPYTQVYNIKIVTDQGSLEYLRIKCTSMRCI